jgi:hypothetical protein
VVCRGLLGSGVKSLFSGGVYEIFFRLPIIHSLMVISGRKVKITMNTARKRVRGAEDLERIRR